MKQLNIFLLFTAMMFQSTQCMKRKLEIDTIPYPQFPLFVLTDDKHITPINKKNIPHMCVLDVMNAHQHKDFAFIDENKKKINSWQNPLDASAITGLTRKHLKLLNKALDTSKDKETFYNFYVSLDNNKRLIILDAAKKVDAPIINCLYLSHLPRDIQKDIISYTQLSSVAAFKQLILRTIPPIVSELAAYTKFYAETVWNPDNSILVSTNDRPNDQHHPYINSYANSLIIIHDDQLIIRDGYTGKPIKVFVNTRANNITFSPDGTRLFYTVSEGYHVKVYLKGYLHDGHTGTWIKTLTIGYAASSEKTMTWSPDSKIFVTLYCDTEQSIMIYSAEKGDLLQRIDYDNKINDLSFTADSTQFISFGEGNKNEKIIVWNINGEKIKYCKGHNNHEENVALSPDYSRFANLLHKHDRFCSLILRDGNTGDEIAHIKDDIRLIAKLLFSPDSKYLLSVSLNDIDQECIIWHAKNGIGEKTFTKNFACYKSLITFAQDNSFLIINDTLYDTQFFEPITILPKELSALALSPNGNCFTARTADNRLVLCTLFTDEMLNIINQIKSGITDLMHVYKITQLCKKIGVKI